MIKDKIPHFLCAVILANSLLFSPEGGSSAELSAKINQTIDLSRLPDGDLWKAAQSSPAWGAVWEEAGIRQAQTGEAQQAVILLERARELDSLSYRGKKVLAESYWKTGQPEAAQTLWQELIQAGEADNDTFRQVVETQRESGSLAAALTTVHAWVQKFPASKEAFYQGAVLLAFLSPEQASGWIEQAEKVDANLETRLRPLKAALLDGAASPESYRLVLVGRALGNLGEWQAAEQAFLMATQNAPDYAEAWAFLGEARERLGKDYSAEIQRANVLDPGSVAARVLLAEQWRRQKKPEVALAIIYQLAREEPEQEIWQRELGNLLAEMGNVIMGVKHYQRATELAPGKAETWQGLARYCLTYNIEIRTLGLPAARQALSLEPENALYLDLMGMILFTLDDDTNAERFLLAAREKDKSLAAVHLHLGEVYFKAGRSEEAKESLREAAARGENDRQAAEQARILLKRYFGTVVSP